MAADGSETESDFGSDPAAAGVAPLAAVGGGSAPGIPATPGVRPPPPEDAGAGRSLATGITLDERGMPVAAEPPVLGAAAELEGSAGARVSGCAVIGSEEQLASNCRPDDDVSAYSAAT